MGLLGEGNPDWKVTEGGAALGSNLTFELGVVDMAGALARAGVRLFARQTLQNLLTLGGVRAGYWTTVLWKQLVGNVVFDTAVSSDTQAVRAYAHSAAMDSSSVTVILINIDEETAAVAVAAPSFDCHEQLVWHVTPEPDVPEVLVNGVRPTFQDDVTNGTVLPSWPPQRSACDEVVSVS